MRYAKGGPGDFDFFLRLFLSDYSSVFFSLRQRVQTLLSKLDQ
jgi:hypothetical protein